MIEHDEFFREEWEEEAEDDPEADRGECVVPSEALRRILEGTVPTDEFDGRAYVTGLVEVYRVLGSEVGQIGFSSNEMVLLEQWDAAMGRAGIPHSFFALSGRGAPFPFPPDEPFPTLGYITPEEVGQVWRLMKGSRTWPWIWRKQPPRPEMDDATYRMFRGWVGEALSREQGLVGVLG